MAVLRWPNQSEAQLVRSGDLAYGKSNLQEAYSSYEKALRADPENASLHVRLAAVYESARNYNQAVDELSLASRLNPKLDLAADLNRTTALRDEPKRLRQEVAELASITQAEPSFRDGWLRLAYLQYQLRDDPAAKAALARALEIDPNFEPALKLAALLP